MSENTENSINIDEWLKDLPSKSEPIGFKSDEMLECQKCKRKSPPTRLKCFYCGNELSISENQQQNIKPHIRKMEEWEKGFNLIYLTQNSLWTEDSLENVVELLKLEKKELEVLLQEERALPLARVESQKAAEILHTRLSDQGLICFIVSDEDLHLETASNRLRSIGLFEDGISLRFFNGDKKDILLWEDIRLIVTGKVFERKVETSEKRTKEEDREVSNTVEASSEETIIDIYQFNEKVGYRVSAKGFDFSCLGENKKLLATENMQILCDILKESANEAKFDNDYNNLRPILKDVWGLDKKVDSRGWQRENFGKINRTNLTTISNLGQFTRYSHLQWHLLNR